MGVRGRRGQGGIREIGVTQGVGLGVWSRPRSGESGGTREDRGGPGNQGTSVRFGVVRGVRVELGG